jgi:hypothetical protein
MDEPKVNTNTGFVQQPGVSFFYVLQISTFNQQLFISNGTNYQKIAAAYLR